MCNKIIYFFLFLIFFSFSPANSQNYTAISAELTEYMDSIGFNNKKDIQSLPDNLLPSGISRLYILVYFNNEVDTLFLLGEGYDSTLYYFGIIEFNGVINTAKTDVLYEEDDETINIYSQMPFSAFYYGAKYNWDPENIEITLIKEWSDDPSINKLYEIDRLLSEGEIEKAGDLLYEIFYPGHYYNDYEMAIKFLRTGFNYAIKSFESGDVEKSCDFIKTSFEVFALTLGSDWTLQFLSLEDYEESGFALYMNFEEEFIQIMNYYGLFLAKADKIDKAIEILEYVLKLSPEFAEATLNLADTYYMAENQNKASTYYKSYIELMTNCGKENLIPQRAYDRQ